MAILLRDVFQGRWYRRMMVSVNATGMSAEAQHETQRVISIFRKICIPTLLQRPRREAHDLFLWAFLKSVFFVVGNQLCGIVVWIRMDAHEPVILSLCIVDGLHVLAHTPVMMCRIEVAKLVDIGPYNARVESSDERGRYGLKVIGMNPTQGVWKSGFWAFGSS